MKNNNQIFTFISYVLFEENNYYYLAASSGLIYFWRFNLNATDSVKGISLTGNEITYQEENGAAHLKFDGGKYLTIDDKLYVVSNDFTIAFWLRVHKQNMFMYFGDANNLIIEIENNYKIKFSYERFGQSRIKISSEKKLDKNKWYHIAFIRQNNMIEIHIDGVKDSEKEFEYLPNHPMLGGFEKSFHETFMSLSDLMIFNRALDTNEIKVAKETPDKFETNIRGLIHFWPFNNQVKDVIDGNDFYGDGIQYINDKDMNPNSAINFDGSNFLTTRRSIHAMTNDFTVAFWIRMNQHRAWGGIFEFGCNDKSFGHYIIICMNLHHRIRFHYFEDEDSGRYADTSILALHEWFHIAYTLKDKLLTIYVDGNKDSDTEFELFRNNIFMEGRIARNVDSTDKSHISLSSLMIFNRALNTNEIKLAKETPEKIHTEIIKN